MAKLKPEDEALIESIVPADDETLKRRAQEEMAKRELSRRYMLPFTERVNPGYMPGWVHKDICQRLERFSEQVARKESPRLMLFMPPRSGKTTLASISFPAWHLGRYPEHEFIGCSYSGNLAMEISRKVRNIMRDPVYKTVFKTGLDPASQSVESWNTAQGGAYLATGVGGPATGRGAHILTIDDPVKNREDAESESARELVWNWYTAVAYTRLAPGGGVLIMQCMTGDTAVLRPDGTQTRLDALQVGDYVASLNCETNRIEPKKVLNFAPQGKDSIYKITMTSGKILRANARHPFLIETPEGRKWIRVKNLTLGQRIVGVKDNGENGKGKVAWAQIVKSLLSAVGIAQNTTPNGNGLQDTDQNQKNPALPVRLMQSLSTATTLHLSNITRCWPTKTLPAQFASLRQLLTRTIGSKFYALTTATPLTEYVDYSATAVTSYSKKTCPKKYCSQLSTICEKIESIEYAGQEEVFDIQVEDNENFIANSYISHNTRWHLDDLSGRLKTAMENGHGDEWEIVEYPAVAQHDEVYRKEGEALHPDRYDLPALQRIKDVIGPRDWAALYQQNPVPDEGDYFTNHMFRYYKPKELDTAKLVTYITWDLAIGQKEYNDFSVAVIGGVDDHDNLYILDVVRGRWPSLALTDLMLDQYETWKPQVIGLEKGHIEMTLGPFIEKRRAERNLYQAHFEPLRVGRMDKMARARAIQGRMEQGKVFWPTGADWMDSVLNEMLSFPNGKHDDIVDAVAHLGQLLGLMRSFNELPEKPPPSWKDNLSKFFGKAGSGHMSA